MASQRKKARFESRTAMEQGHKIFNDPIHGHIELHPLCIKIIDTPQFQRLRYLRQLGGCYFVFPGASHNRFEHCLGTSHLAGELAKNLQSRQPELNITAEDILCVQVAGLCHDIGHGPFSHAFDGFIKKVKGETDWTHEKGSQRMFDYLVKDNGLEQSFDALGLTESYRTFIKELITGEAQKGYPVPDEREKKHFLFEIVANKLTGIDVDKWDYFARDSHYLGIKSNFDHIRFMKFARVLDVKGVKQICIRDKEVFNLYNMFYIRAILHRRACKHKTNVIIEEMICEAMAKADDYITIPCKDGVKKKMSEAIDDMEAYCKLNDTILNSILLDANPDLKASQEILTNIQKRQLPVCVAQGTLTTDISEKDIPDIRSKVEQDAKLPEKSVTIKIANFNYGKKKKVPTATLR